MDHDVVVREKMTEKYLLEELSPELRDQFEEHFFDCPDCALDVRAGSEFVTHSKSVLAERAEPVVARAASPGQTPVHRPVHTGWFAWLRPTVAVPVLALLLVVVGYQNLVTYPNLQSALKRAQVLPWASVTVGTWGANGTPLTVPQSKGFLLFVRVPSDGNYAYYMADLYDPAGKLECSVTIPVTAGNDQWPVLVPGKNREAGSYKMTVRGVTAAGESKDLGSASFELQIQK